MGMGQSLEPPPTPCSLTFPTVRVVVYSFFSYNPTSRYPVKPKGHGKRLRQSPQVSLVGVTGIPVLIHPHIDRLQVFD